MLEQTMNIRSSVLEMRLFFKKLSILVVSCIALFLSACVPIGDQEINTSLFKSKEDMKMRAAELKPGMSKKAGARRW